MLLAIVRELDRPSHWHVGDAEEIVTRAQSRELLRWGLASQVLPDF